jgi:hypothetical protein
VGERRRIYRDADGVRRTMIWDDEDPDQFVVNTEQDVEEILDGVHRDQEAMAHDGVNKLLAKVPVAIYERSVHEKWDEGDWARWLNDPDNSRLRVWKGQV